jgi:ribose 5-phosphate isomerase A
MNNQDKLKQEAAFRAVEFIESGMVVGLGTGSTAKFAVDRIAERLNSGELSDIVGIPSSIRTENQARELGIPLVGFDEQPRIDVTIDGADEVDPDLNLIKGGGGALLREKVLAQASRRNIIIVDESKLVPKLGTTWAVPVEVIPFACRTEDIFLRSLGGDPLRRTDKGGAPFLTDQNNMILDTNFGPMSDPHPIAAGMNERAAIIEHGLFLNLATDVIVAEKEGIRHLNHG